MDTQNLLDYVHASPLIKALSTDWAAVEAQTRKNRDMRYFKVDVESKRQSGELQVDETYIPCRIVDSNIRKEQPKFVLYVTQSRRSLVLKSKDIVDTEKLEALFTDNARYRGWELPFLRTIDGAQCQGWDNVEVRFDAAYPGHFCIDHVGHDDLVFPQDCENIQKAEMILRRCRFTKLELRERIETDGFNTTMVDDLIAKYPSTVTSTKDILFDVLKVYFKQDGIVYVAWYVDKVADTWLADPKPLFNGRLVKDVTIDPMTGQTLEEWVDAAETEYPFHTLGYTEGEDPRIIAKKGRAYLDEADQEAATAILSGYVNGLIRSTNMFATVSGNTPSDGTTPTPLKSVSLRNGAIYDAPLTFAYLPAPNEACVRAFQTILTKNSGETANVEYAVNNRVDSRKTATEVASAEQKSAELGSVQVTLLSIFMCNVYDHAFKIWQAQVASGRLQLDDPTDLSLFLDNTGNLRKYLVFSAGDVDVVKRQEKLSRKMQFWPVVSNTAAAIPFLQSIIKDAFPEDAEMLNALIAQGDQQKMLIDKLSKVVQALAIDPHTGQLTEEAQPFANELGGLAQQVQQTTMTDEQV